MITYRKVKLQLAMVTSLGFISILLASQWFAVKHEQTPQLQLAKEFPTLALASMGHTEFGWSVAALEVLAHTVNAWISDEDSNLDSQKKEQIRERFYQFYEHIDALAAVQLGMRELFTYPASYLAFERNDIESALRIAELGAQDDRLTPDLALVIAYLKHLFHPDLSEVADAYERVLLAYPQAKWLQKTIADLRRGDDPLLRPNQDQCQKLLFIFPKAQKKLVERKICKERNEDSKQ